MSLLNYHEHWLLPGSFHQCQKYPLQDKKRQYLNLKHHCRNQYRQLSKLHQCVAGSSIAVMIHHPVAYGKKRWPYCEEWLHNQATSMLFPGLIPANFYLTNMWLQPDEPFSSPGTFPQDQYTLRVIYKLWPEYAWSCCLQEFEYWVWDYCALATGCLPNVPWI